MTDRPSLALALGMVLAQPDLPPEVARHIVEAMRETARPRDQADPMQLRRDVTHITALLQDLYGEGAITQAKRVSKALGEPAFARVVIRSLERKERERLRGQIDT